jgi:hypothetical protein
MDYDTEQHDANKGSEEEFETFPESTDHTDCVLLEPPELCVGGNNTCDSTSCEGNIPLHSKGIGLPANIMSDIIGVAKLKSTQSTGSDSLVGAKNIRKESESDGVNTGTSDNKCDESEGVEVEICGSTEEFYNDVNNTVTSVKPQISDNVNVFSEKDKNKEKGEHEAHGRQVKGIKEVSDKVKKELEKQSDKEKEKVVLSDLKKKEIEEQSDEKKGKVELNGKEKKEVAEQNDKEKHKVELSDKEKKEVEEQSDKEKEKVEPSDKEKKEIEKQSGKEKEKVELHDKGEETHVDVNKPENIVDKCPRESKAVEMLGCENKETNEKTPEGEKTVSTGVVRAGSEERQMDVGDTDSYPEHINFVDVNAPNYDSPMVIDDDDDEIVMLERRKGTNPSRRSAKKKKDKTDNSNHNSSPDVVVQEELCKRRKEIVIDLDDDDDDDIEIETIKKKKKKKKSNARKGVCCCNTECSTPGQALRGAPVFVLTYYGRKYKKGKAEKVCTVCFEAAMQHNEVGVSMCVCVYVCVSVC